MLGGDIGLGEWRDARHSLNRLRCGLMTQVIGAITQDYVLLAADRRLVYIQGPQRGQLKDDDTCKLVSICNVSGIGYTGLAEIEGVPTHQWIAKTLAAENCSDAGTASRLLAERTQLALANVDRTIRRHTFLIAGWALFQNLTGLRPHLCAISNMIDGTGQIVSTANDVFTVFAKALNDSEDLAIYVVGHPLSLDRRQRLEGKLRDLVTRNISPKAALGLLVAEITYTSTRTDTVGQKILGFCIPRKAALAGMQSGHRPLLATEPNEDTASFCYFDPTYDELQQFGPTVTCGGFAITDVITENDPSQKRQSAQVRILALPKGRGPSPAPPSAATFKRPEESGPTIGLEFGISVENAVAPGASYTIPAAIKNTGDVPIIFAKNLSDDVGQEVPPSIQGGAVPAITFGWPSGDWSLAHFAAGSRSQFSGVVLPPGQVFEFSFGTLRVPNAPIGGVTRTSLVDFSVRLTDTVKGSLLNARGARFHFPTNVNPTLTFTIAAESGPSALTFAPARVIDTAAGELISGPVDGWPLRNSSSSIFTDTSICQGKPGIGTGSPKE